MIREAVRADIPRLVVMGLHFIRSTGYARHISENPDALFSLMLRLIEHEDAVIFVAVAPASGFVTGEPEPTGMIGVHVFTHPMSGEVVASEAFWWVEPEARGTGMALLRAGEEWAREQGAKQMQMIAPDERTAQAYERLGFEQLETHYQKVI